MIPILYNGTEQAFLSNGLGRLSDAITCQVTEERNGSFELEMTYPVSGIHFADIAVNRIILAKTEDGGNNQAFIIYKVSKPLNGIVTINAEHISYLLNGFVVMPFSAVSCADAISKIAANSVPTNPFAFFTDVSSTVAFNLTTPRGVRGLLGGEQGSILDTYGGYDYKFDNFNVYLLTDRGADHGVTIRYGKNLTALKDTNDTTNVFTGIVPYWISSEGDDSVYLPEKVVLSSHASDYPYYIIQSMDFSGDFEEKPTEAQLRAKAESYMQSSQGWKIKNDIDVSFVNLAQTEEYKDFAQLERVRLCDTVTVIYDKLGVNVKTKVIKTVYNVLTERYDSISLGDTTYTLAQAIQGAIDTPTEVDVTNSIKSAVNRATKLIQGGLGGHVVFNTNGDGEPQEILIMDTDDISTAVNVIRMNLNGIGFSHNGYAGPFDTAWTIDGHFVADYIDTGELNGNLIKANTVSANALTVSSQNDLGLIHDYLPYDVITNTSRWHLNAPAYGQSCTAETRTISGEPTQVIVLDDTQGTLSIDIQARIYSDITGTPTIHIKLKYQFETSFTLASDYNFLSISLYDEDGTSYANQNKVIVIPAGNIIAGTEYTFDQEFTVTGDAYPFYEQGYKHAMFIFHVPERQSVVLYDLEATGANEEYRSASLTFTQDGLNSVVQAGSVISSINQSAEQVSIKANKIDLTGDLSLHGDFTSYKANDNTTYAFMDSGSISFFNQGANIFTVASTPLLGQNAGIFFGDADDGQTLARYTYLTQEFLQTPTLLVRKDGSQTVPTGAGDAMVEGDFTVYGKSKFYGNVYNANGGVQFVSDRRKKKSIKDLATEKAKSFLMALSPRMFKFKEGTSDRYHHGFIAQEVKEAMGKDDWGVYCEDKENDFIGLRYDEIIADLVKVVQDQEERINALERMIHDNSNI